MKQSIEEMARLLKLPYIRQNYQNEVEHAVLEDSSFEEFLQQLLEREMGQRAQNSVQRKIRQAHFPNRMTFENYQVSHLPSQIRQKIKLLQTLKFIDNHENVILVGNPGVGKTALAICLGMKACMNNYSVLFINIPNLMIELREAMSNNQIMNYKRKFERYDLVILDELGYVSFDKDSGEILFNLLSNRTDKKSIVITSNLTVDHWSEVFKDTRLTTAIVDRMAYKAHLIDLSGDSYRIKETLEWSNSWLK